ncbi:MAG: 1,4-dihydroxy-2-naphthoate polyprenyltransferase, partial [Halobacteriovoraceae bacterium]|nr:1,4-dihydroxy-2-naphthoate polyprenyltransferase [Halobacteriovoraceae bacterium]
MNLILKGMRPKTLVAAIVPPMCAYAYYYAEFGLQNISYFFLCVLLALFIQIATNFYNDAIDHLKGADE